jgi:hypothetical protein
MGGKLPSDLSTCLTIDTDRELILSPMKPESLHACKFTALAA